MFQIFLYYLLGINQKSTFSDFLLTTLLRVFRVLIAHVCLCVTLCSQELYQKLTDYDIRFYMYELLKVRDAALCFSPSHSQC